MCGIAGIVDFSGRAIDASLIGRMCAAVSHRGPDGSGMECWLPEGAGQQASACLGHQRLNVIDPQGGRQPLANEDRSVWAVVNGEIYNFQALRGELEAQGHRFATRCDSEVVVHLYEQHGEAFVEKLEGMFALAVWDRKKQRLLLARDRFGKKPLYYARAGSRWVFASELNAVVAEPSVPRQIDPQALRWYLAYLAIPAPWSIYQAVRKVSPASIVVIDALDLRSRTYWSLQYAPKWTFGISEAQERLELLLSQAVGKRLVSDVSLGAFLSGGMDSSVVVALMSRFSKSVKTFTVGFDEPRYDERPYARQVAKAFGCEHHEIVVRPDASEMLQRIVRQGGEPFADSSAIPTFYLSQWAKRSITVALTGDGGDELFAGYGRHRLARQADWFANQPALFHRLADPLMRFSGRSRRFLDACRMSRAKRYRAWSGVHEPAVLGQLLAAEAAASDEAVIEDYFEEYRLLDCVDAFCAVDARFYLPTDLLVKMDLMSMANGLEVRAPFLDHHVAGFAARLPASWKLNATTSKFLVKRALGRLLPRAILSRPKRGFSVPLASWLRGELRTAVLDNLNDSQLARSGLLRQAPVSGMVDAHLRGQADWAHPIWTLLVLEIWFREVHQAPAVTKSAEAVPAVAA